MIGQYSEERLNTSGEPEGTEKPSYNSEVETNPLVDETTDYEYQDFETEADELYIGPDLTVEPMEDDVPMWKPEPAVNFVDDVEDDKIPTTGEVILESSTKPEVDVQATLLKTDDLERFQTRWNGVQGNFVDDPQAAVQQADELVSEVVELITQKFAAERNILEGQWKQGNDVSTEDLRKALQHYRAFFKRLVV